jgi:hypothetical protein
VAEVLFAVGNDDGLEQMRSELVKRVKVNPLRSWSANLLIAVIDLGAGRIDDEATDRVFHATLRIIG